MILPDLTRAAVTDPTEIIDLRDSMYAGDLFIAALAELDFFTWLAKTPSAADQIAGTLGLAARPLDVMLTLFTAMGLVEAEDGVYHVTRLAEEHLTADAPWSLVAYCASLRERPGCKEMIEVLKSGHPANWSSRKDGEQWANALNDDSFAGSFTAAMDSRGASLGPVMAERLPCNGGETLLDIAGGSGIYAACVAARYPEMTVAVLERPPVDRVTRVSLARRNLAGRVSVIGADMFADPLPSGYAIHLYSHVLHDWDMPQVKLLLAKSYDALPPGGMVAIHDAHLNAEKTGPLAVARYSVLLMHSTEGRCYSVGEMAAWLQEIGFVDVEHIPAAAHRSLVTATKPRK